MFLSACYLALKDLVHDGLLSLCHILSLVGMLIPLLILLGVRNGVVYSLEERLLENPALLSILPTGSGSYTKADIDSFAKRDDVTFVIPKTREISTVVQLYNNVQGEDRLLAVELEPTAENDPLLAPLMAVPPDTKSLTLSYTAASRLGVKAGEDVTLRLGRTNLNGQMQSTSINLMVSSILPLEATGRLQAFILLPLLEDIENYKDGYAVEAWGMDGEAVPPDERLFAKFRLYAKTIDDVAILREYFSAQDIEVNTSALEIKSFQQISRALTSLFLLIALTVGIGFLASMSSSSLAAVRRKDKRLAVLRLIGFSGFGVMLFPIIQALITALCACTLAGLIYLAAARVIDILFSENFAGARVCHIPPDHFLFLMLGICLLSLAACLPAARRAAGIEPADILREI